RPPRRRAERDLWITRNLYCHPAHAPVYSAGSQKHARFSAVLSGSRVRSGILDRRRGARDHASSLHHLGITRGAPFRAPRSTGGRAGAGGYAVGSDLESGCALRPQRHSWLHLPRTGPRAWGNHGGHHGYWKHTGHQRLSVLAGRFHRFGYCQPIQGSYRRPVLAIAHRAWSGAFPSDFHSQWACPLADPGNVRARRRNGAPMSLGLGWRKFVSGFMLTMTGICAVVAVSALFLILGYLVFHGGASVNWNFFTKLPVPVGETGGGIANAIVGSGKLLLLATLIGVPIGFLGAIYLAEFSGSKVAFVVRYAADLLNGVPSIVIGIFAYSLVVLPFKHFSTLAGGFALGLMMIPITLRSTEEFLLAVPRALREAAMALGASKWKTIVSVIVPAAYRGILTAILLAFARVAGETAPLLFTALGNSFWSPGWNQPTASLPVVIYNYAISPYEDWHAQACAAGLVLLSLFLAINIVALGVLARGTRFSGS